MPSKFWSRSHRSNAPVTYPAEAPPRAYSRQDAYDPRQYSPDPYQQGDFERNPPYPGPYGRSSSPVHPDDLQPPPSPGFLVSDEAGGQSPHSFNPPPPQDQRPVTVTINRREEEPKRSLRKKLGFGSSRENVNEHESSSSKLSLGRKVSHSVRRKGSPDPSHQQYSDRQHPYQGQWQESHESTSGLSPYPASGRDEHLPNHSRLYGQQNDSYASSYSDEDRREGSPEPGQGPNPNHNPQYQAYRGPNSAEHPSLQPPPGWSNDRPAETIDDDQKSANFDYRPPEYKPQPDSLARQGSITRKQPPGPPALGGLKVQQPSSDPSQILAPSPSVPAKQTLQKSNSEAGNRGAMGPPNAASAKGLQSQDSEMGRQTPPPQRGASEMSEQDVNQMIKDYKELREKYSKVKRLYFEKDDAVKNLQNTLAHQRLSQSRTSLDDGEYIARWQRLEGLISNLAFTFRKDWKTIPNWLQPYVNKDAISVGKQEMTAVGRAFISRWLTEEVFEKYFHPGLPQDLSVELKTIQKNIRVYCPPFQSGEEEEALNAKIISWRMATIDGLQHKLTLHDANGRRQVLIDTLNKQLLTALQDNMQDPPPAGLEGNVSMIIELAVGILVHLPQESRDVHIEYYLPGCPISQDLMRVETTQAPPPLTNPISTVEKQEADKASTTGDSKDNASDPAEDDGDGAGEPEQGKKGIFGGFMGSSKKPNTGIPGQGTPKHGSAATSQTSLVQPPGSAGGIRDDGTPRVRLCLFLGLQIRGKRILAQAPIFRT